MITLNAQLLFSRVNSMSPKVFPIKNVSVYNDFAFVNRMFSKTGNDIWEGINVVKKSNNTKRKSRSN